MTAATVARLGANNKDTDKLELFLELFGGLVMGIYQNNTVAMNRHMVRTIMSGKAAQFPAYGRVSAAYHTPGAEIVGADVNVSERVINIDDMLVSSVFLAEIDELMNHYDLSGPYANEMGYSLANANDKNVLQLGALAARATTTVTDGAGGSIITDSDCDTSAASLLASIFAGQVLFDEKNIPEQGRQLFLKPAQYTLLAQLEKVLDSDYSRAPADLGKGKLGPELAGFEIVKSNNVPTADVSTGPSAYQGLFNTTVAVATHSSAVGTVKLRDIVVAADWDERRLGTLMTARQAIGSGILRPEGAIEFRTAAQAT